MTKESLIRHGFLFIATLFAMALACFWLYLALNYADDTGSFMLATSLLVTGALVIAGLCLAAWSKTGLLGGALIGLIVLVGSIVLYNTWRPFENLDLGSLGLGFVGLLVLAAGFCLVFIAASRYNRKAVRRSANAPSLTVPEPHLA